MMMHARGRGVFTRTQGSRFQVRAPYNPAFPVEAHKLNGRWRKRSAMWSFARHDYAKVAAIVNKLYGEGTQLLPVAGVDNASA
jgi:hypothetical protein